MPSPCLNQLIKDLRESILAIPRNDPADASPYDLALGGLGRVVGQVLAEEHGADPGDAEDASVQLAHLAEYVGLLYPFDDPALVEADVVEVARLILMFGCRCPIQPTKRGTAHSAAGDREVRSGGEVV